MDLALGIWIGAAGVVFEMAIGATGIGCVLLVLILILALSIGVTRAIAAALQNYAPAHAFIAGENPAVAAGVASRVPHLLPPVAARQSNQADSS
jgi:hypothetical protein